jgi:hypothetical protein
MPIGMASGPTAPGALYSCDANARTVRPPRRDARRLRQCPDRPRRSFLPGKSATWRARLRLRPRRPPVAQRAGGRLVLRSLRWSQGSPRRKAIDNIAMTKLLLALCKSLAGVIRILGDDISIALVGYRPLRLAGPGGGALAGVRHHRHERNHNNGDRNDDTHQLNFLRSTECGQAVGERDLGQVLHHEEPGHEPLPGS